MSFSKNISTNHLPDGTHVSISFGHGRMVFSGTVIQARNFGTMEQPDWFIEIKVDPGNCGRVVWRQSAVGGELLEVTLAGDQSQGR